MRYITILVVNCFWLSLLLIAACGRSTAANDNTNQIFDVNQLSFSIPNDWKVVEDSKSPWGSRMIGIDTSGISLINIEVFPKEKLTAPEDQAIMSSIKKFAHNYNKKANTFGKLATTSNPAVTDTVSRSGYEGLREAVTMTMFNQDASYIREFYRVDFTDQVVFVVFDADKKEFSKFSDNFSQLLTTLKHL